MVASFRAEAFADRCRNASHHHVLGYILQHDRSGGLNLTSSKNLVMARSDSLAHPAGARGE